MSRPPAQHAPQISLDVERLWRAQRLLELVRKSRRKFEIVCLLSTGNREAIIAEALGIRRGTVHSHVQALFSALQIHDRLLLGIAIADAFCAIPCTATDEDSAAVSAA